MTTLLSLAMNLAFQEGVSLEERRLLTIRGDVEVGSGMTNSAGTKASYMAMKWLKAFVVVGDGESETCGPEFDEVAELAFGPDGKTLAYKARIGKQWFLVVGDQRSEPFDDISYFEFNPKEKELAFIAREGDRWLLNRGGAKLDTFEWQGCPVFSPRGGQLACVRSEGSQQRVEVFGGRSQESFDEVWNPSFSADGTVLYPARRKGEWFLVRGGTLSDPYDFVGEPTCSPAGKSVAFAAGKGEKRFVVKDGVKGSVFDDVAWLVLSPDGKHVAYTANLGGKREPRFVHVEGGKWFIVVDGKCGEPFDDVFEPVFSPNGKRVAYWATLGQKSCVVVDGKKGPMVGGAPWYAPDWNLDGKLLVYAARVNGSWRVRVEDTWSDPFDDLITPPTFSPDGRAVTYGVRIGNELWWKVMKVE